MRGPSQPDKLKAIAAMALGSTVVALGVAFAIISPRSAGGTAGATSTAPTRSPGSPAPTRLPYAFEGDWDLDFEASGLVRPSLDVIGARMASSLRLHAGRVQWISGFISGCDDRSGTFESDGTGLTIDLGPNRISGCNRAVIDEVIARLGRTVSVSLWPCPAGYRSQSSDTAPTDGSCRELRLLDETQTTLLIYVSNAWLGEPPPTSSAAASG